MRLSKTCHSPYCGPESKLLVVTVVVTSSFCLLSFVHVANFKLPPHVLLTPFSIPLSLSSPWQWWVGVYGVTTAIVVALNTLSMVTCTLILGSILKNGKSYVSEEAEEVFMAYCRRFIDECTAAEEAGDRTGADGTPARVLRPPAPRLTFETFWEQRCEDHWRRAFNMFSGGVLAFLICLITIGLINFNYSKTTSGLFVTIVFASLIAW
ncbi:hypothetical protein CBR_g39631 [Chara braunii]|uniref:Uncharacterized protein n=1 Tax=Chara braunii TaxID=69332 RepID=A0A388K1D7_CHABU|nr:hypothetical protein CBR_g39631 [Chara braunii]|eukprot:GBG63847.1 hypothetical protein CBR_g39631 [Chara braunii]